MDTQHRHTLDRKWRNPKYPNWAPHQSFVFSSSQHSYAINLAKMLLNAQAGLTPLEVMMKLFPGQGRGPDCADMTAQDYRSYLGKFGVSGDLALQVQSLSTSPQ